MKTTLKILTILYLAGYPNYTLSQINPLKCNTDEYFEMSLKENNLTYQQFKNKVNNYKPSPRLTLKNTNNQIIIPVVFHVIHNDYPIGSNNNLSVAKLEEQIEIVNRAYRNDNNKGVDMGIRFCLAKKDKFGNEHPGIIRYRTNRDTIYGIEEDKLIKGNHSSLFPNTKYLNIWTVNLPEKDYGYSSLPYEFTYEYPIKDGIVLNYNYVGNGTTSDGIDRGQTLVHEIGHWLGLWHTFHKNQVPSIFKCYEEDCTQDGDQVCDTEPRKVPAWTEEKHGKKVINKDDCDYGYKCDKPDEKTSAIQNYMDYNFDKCVTFFTQGQKDRVWQMLMDYRREMLLYSFPVTECQEVINPPDPDPVFQCYDAIDNNYTLNIQTGYQTKNFCVDGNTLGISSLNDNSRLILLYKIDECSITYDSAIATKGHIATYFDIDRERISVTDFRIIEDRVVVTVVNKNTAKTYLVTFKNTPDSWQIDQAIEISNKKNPFILSYDKSNIYIASANEVVIFSYNANNYSISERLSVPLLNSEIMRVTSESFFDGEYLIARIDRPSYVSTDYQLFRRDRNTFKHLKTFNIRYGTILLKCNSLYVVDNNNFDDKGSYFSIYDLRNDLVQKRHGKHLSGLFSNNNTNRPEAVTSIASVGKNIIALGRHGAGITFHHTLDGFNDLKVPALQNEYPANVLNPYNVKNHRDFQQKVSVEFANYMVTKDNMIITGDNACRRLFVYRTNNLLQNSTADLTQTKYDVNLCNEPSSSYTEGNIITIGENCNANFTSSNITTIQADQKVVVKTGTVLGINSKTVLKAKQFDNIDIGQTSCTLTYHQRKTKVVKNQFDAVEFVTKRNTDDLEPQITKKNEYQIVPIPVKNRFNLSNNSGIKFTFIIYDILGQRVFVSKNNFSNHQIDFSGKKSGVYLVKIVDEHTNIQNLKFVKK